MRRVKNFPAMAAFGLPEAVRADAASGIPTADAGGADRAAALDEMLDAARRHGARSATLHVGDWRMDFPLDDESPAKRPQPAAPQGAQTHSQRGRAGHRRSNAPNTPRDVDHDWRAAMNRPAGRCTGMGDAQKSAQAQQQERRQHGAARTAGSLHEYMGHEGLKAPMIVCHSSVPAPQAAPWPGMVEC